MDVTSHGSGGYRTGCRCDICRKAETLRKANYRARGGSTVVSMPASSRSRSGNARRLSRVGPVEEAVSEEAASSAVAPERPAIVAMAKAMARILDSDDLVAMHPQAARQLQASLTQLAPRVKKSKGRLAAVRGMTQRG